ncbi:MAG: hypothetical protein ACXAEF_04970 [Candidatus Thorarchaeota archaeon]|jgi:hypothetical protein
MRDLSIVYEGRFGRQEEEMNSKSTLNLYMRAATKVNLEPLRDNSELETVELSKNQLESVDLEPLRSCPKLKRIRLRGNRLSSINLWPLMELPSLEEIDLVDNRIHEINITPFIGKVNFFLDEGVRVTIDYLLRYLVGGKDTSSLHVCKPSGEELVSSPRIQWQRYSDIYNDIGWESLQFNSLFVLEKLDERCWFRAQKGFLEGMGLSELSGFDGDPSKILRNLEDTSDFQSVRSSVYDVTIELLEEQLSVDGPTLFLDIGKMAGTRASKLIPLISTLRDMEIENAVVHIGGNKVNLLPLWLTHWGYEILKVLRFGLTTDLEGFELLQKNFRKIGYEVKSDSIDPHEMDDPKNISKGLVDYIYTIATMNYTNRWIRR